MTYSRLRAAFPDIRLNDKGAAELNPSQKAKMGKPKLALGQLGDEKVIGWL